MLQRMRELAVQASNDTNTDTDRAFIQEEVNLLVAEISRVSSNTRYNGEKVLDGSFTSKQLQVGTEAGETISMSIDSVSANLLGAHQVVGDRIEAQVGTGGGAYANITDAGDDIVINGNSMSKTIDVAAADNAKDVATKINAVSGQTGVTAEAKTYALLSSEYATDQTYSVRINNKTTGSFIISNTSVLDAVDKINSISGSTGVTASATTDNKVRLYSDNGSDILVENESTGTALKFKPLVTTVHLLSRLSIGTMPHLPLLDTARARSTEPIQSDSSLQGKSTLSLWHLQVPMVNQPLQILRPL